MIGMTLCSGIGAPELAAPWVDWRFASEIEAFPRAVLQERFSYKTPEDHNQGDSILWGDMTDVTPDLLRNRGIPLPDLIVAGTPCQAFSIAGLRKGLSDERGNLTLEFLRKVDALKPDWVLWENVPGVLSTEGNPLEQMLLAFNEMGYICDLDILDAQHFGVPQRRRRVFLVCHKLATGRKKKLPFFATATATFLTDSFLTILNEASKQSLKCEENLGCLARHAADGQKKRMKLFGLSAYNSKQETEGIAQLTNLLKDWVETIRLFPNVPNSLDLTFDHSQRQDAILDERSQDGEGEKAAELLSTSTLQLWSNILVEALSAVNMSTTSTATKTITTSQIYSCAETLLSIAQFIINSTGLPANYFDEASSLLTAIKGYTNYARQAASDIFGEHEWISKWWDYEQRATKLGDEIERCLGASELDPAKVLFEPKGVRRDTAQGENQRQGTAVYSQTGIGKYSEGIGTLRASGGDLGGRSENLCVENNRVFPTLDASMDQKFGSNQWVDSAQYVLDEPIAFDCKAGGKTALAIGDKSTALRGEGHGGGHSAICFGIDDEFNARSEQMGTLRRGGQGGRQEFVAYGIPGNWIGRSPENGGNATEPPFERIGALTATDRHGVAYDVQDENAHYAVRRLTPVECHRLQGFPDDHCAITYRGKPASDGPQYKALGNSMAVPVVRWIMDRISKGMANEN